MKTSRSPHGWFFYCAAFLFFALGQVPLTAAERPVVVCTTSMGAAAVGDLAGDAVTVETLMPAGTCPGQFDLEPNQVRRVRTAVLVVRHEMQGFLDARFAAAGVPADAVAALSFGGSFNVPSNYARFCAALASELTKRVPTLAGVVPPRLAAVRARAENMETELRRTAAPLKGLRVVAALYQVDFLRWLGLDVVATFPPADDPAPAALQAALAAGRRRGAVLVVGNEQNGQRTTALLAAELGVPAVTLSNFPAQAAAGAYWELVATNLKGLLAARVPQTKQG
ncbi:MAG: zinc ABC transporter substrate-binding protein [Opitutae bacterium]|nr:zinc ABC transporter substrate-binding protein [Opitutae bacterium]